MSRKKAIVSLGILIFGIASLLAGCAPAVVAVRPPEPRVEVYGAPPYPDAVWIPGYWEHRRGDWVWIPGHWTKPPRHGGAWAPGRWESRRGGWIWVPGRWVYR